MSQQKNPDELTGKTPQLIEAPLNQACKEDVLTMYEDLLQTISERIQPTLGRATVMTILERALALTAKDYPVVMNLEVTPQGLSFEPLRKRLNEEECNVLPSALKVLVATLVDILTMLTGDILVQQLIEEIEGRQS